MLYTAKKDLKHHTSCNEYYYGSGTPKLMGVGWNKFKETDKTTESAQSTDFLSKTLQPCLEENEIVP